MSSKNIFNMKMTFFSCEAKLDRSKFGSGVLCPAFDQTFPTTIQVKSHM